MNAFDLPAFVPEDLKQLLRFVPTRGWEALEWRPLLASMQSLSWRYASGRGVRRLAAKSQQFAPSMNFDPAPQDALPIESLRQAGQRRRVGDRVLQFYFRQWLVEEGLFLDLRPGRFSLASPNLYFRPNGLWIRPRPAFREGMLALYRSFYADDRAAIRAALRQTGMLSPDLDSGAEAELLELLRAHFGVDQEAQRFSIDGFKASFDRLFDFFIAHDCRLHSDFVFAGFCLITLYLTLERLGQAHDVRRICNVALLGNGSVGPTPDPGS